MDSDCVDNSSCTVEICNTKTSQCIHTMSNECCGDFICEADEYATCGDYGPCHLDLYYGPNYNASGIMFDVAAIGGLVLSNITI